MTAPFCLCRDHRWGQVYHRQECRFYPAGAEGRRCAAGHALAYVYGWDNKLSARENQVVGRCLLEGDHRHCYGHGCQRTSFVCRGLRDPFAEAAERNRAAGRDVHDPAGLRL